MSEQRKLGLIDKYVVERTDGRSAPGEKHERCRYFVLDLTHDPHAIPALRAYADSAEADGYNRLAFDLRELAATSQVLREAGLEPTGGQLMTSRGPAPESEPEGKQ